MLRAALRDSASRRFFTAHGQSCLGSGLAHVALPLLAYDKTGSAWAVTAVLIPDLMPAILFGPLLGALVDRVGWRACAIAADLLRFLGFTLVVFAHSLPALVLAAAFAGTGTALFAPAALAGVTRLAPADRRPAALGLFGALDDIGLTVGPALAAGLLAVTGAESSSPPTPPRSRCPRCCSTGVSGQGRAASDEVEYRSIWTDLREGLRVLGGRAEVRLLLASSTAAVLFAGVTNVGEVLLARDVLGAGGSGLAALVDRAPARHGARVARRPLQARRSSGGGPTSPGSRAWPSTFCCARSPQPAGAAAGVRARRLRQRLRAGARPSAARRRRADALHGRVFALQKALTSLAFAASFVAASISSRPAAYS